MLEIFFTLSDSFVINNKSYYNSGNSLKIYKVWTKNKFLGYPWTTTLDLSYIDDYQSITKDDFIYKNVGMGQSNQGNSFSMYVSLTYDNTTGKLTLGSYDTAGVNLNSFYFLFDLYVIPGLHNYL